MSLLFRNVLGCLSVVLFGTVVWTAPAFGAADSLLCEQALSPIQPVTLHTLRKANTARLNELKKLYPPPAFHRIEDEVKKEQVAMPLPRALANYLGPKTAAVMLPSPAAPSDTAIFLHSEGRSFPVDVAVEHHGRETKTTVYASLPRTLKPVEGDGFLVGTEYPIVLVHLHGGGTPTASGKNGMSIAEQLAGKGIPVIAPDLPGHGQATRKIDGFASYPEQVEWLMKVVNQLVHPNVKIVLSGHSWGAEFAVFMHRLKLNPKYAHLVERIVLFIPMSPPVDTSLGGSRTQRFEFEDWFQKNFHQFKDRIADTDYDFLSNLLVNGKVSPVGSYHTSFTNMDYSVPPYKAAEQKHLAPMVVIQGTADGLTYVGREEAFHRIFDGLVLPSQLVMLDKELTWKSPTKLYPTGHGIFDARNYYVYKLIADLILGQVTEQQKQEMLAAVSTPEKDKDPVAETLDELVRDILNFPLFVTLLQNRVEYVSMQTPERQQFIERKDKLTHYLRQIEIIQKHAIQDLEQRLKKAVEEFKQEIGLKENWNLARVQEELGWPMPTAERRQQLATYVAAIEANDQKLNTEFKDPIFDQQIVELATEFSGLLTQLKITTVEEYLPYHEKYQALKGGKLSDSEKTLRGELSRLHQRFSELRAQKQGRFGKERERLAESVVKPAGVSDVKAARRELAGDWNPERRRLLAVFAERFESVQAEVRAVWQKELDARIEMESRPDFVSSLDEALALRKMNEGLDSFSYAPPNDPLLGQLAREIEQVQAERQTLAPKITEAEKRLKELKSERAKMMKAWDLLWEDDRLSSAGLDQLNKEFETALLVYVDTYAVESRTTGERTLELKDRGELTESNVLNFTEAQSKSREAFFAAESRYKDLKARLPDLRWQEAVAGRLKGPPELVASAASLAQELFVVPQGDPTQCQTITCKLARLEHELEVMREEQSRLMQTYELSAFRYASMMRARGIPLPQELKPVNVTSWLYDRSPEELLRALKEDQVVLKAFRSTLKTMAQFKAQLRLESESKDHSSY